VLNVASATGTDPDDVETTDTDTEEVFATQSPAITLVKTALDSSYAAPGDVLDYELVATNTGNVTLTDVTCPIRCSDAQLHPGDPARPRARWVRDLHRLLHGGPG